jgi:hypothetical protein
MRAINSDNIEVAYTHDEEGAEENFVILKVSNLHYFGSTRTGFRFGPPKHDYSELK